MAVNGKVQVVGIVLKVSLQTTGVDANTVYTDIVLPKVDGWGPHLVGMTAHTNLEQFTANFKWKLVMMWSFDGITWSAPATDIFAWSTTAGQAIQTAFTDTTKLGLHIRFALACAPSTGTALERGTVSVALAFEFKS